MTVAVFRISNQIAVDSDTKVEKSGSNSRAGEAGTDTTNLVTHTSDIHTGSVGLIFIIREYTSLNNVDMGRLSKNVIQRALAYTKKHST
jgi:hypothetical protein